MASRFDNIQTPDQFDEVTKQIEDAFDKLVQLIHSRKISLLTKLSDYRIEFDNLVASRIQTEKELHSMKQQIENVTANELKSMQDKFLSEIEEKLHKLTLSTTSFELDFQINSHIIEQGISKLGKIIKVSELIVPNYSVMKMPVVAVGKRGSLSCFRRWYRRYCHDDDSDCVPSTPKQPLLNNTPRASQTLAQKRNIYIVSYPNQIIDVISNHIQCRLLDKVKIAKWFTVIADEVIDLSNKEMLSLVLRYVDSYTGLIREDFINFLECDSGITGLYGREIF
ncbi:52 kDa repressor of the inhibitor of the protein kinase-like [Oopsacas minuta]|uniref:52 kDa repressor of the inhibitor of the protein kinase-like n=1 Tax=Oopsacas minuta TaxID=111878 RepID=A0AAV7KC51_9METZ|nr:52 kDa repressor of the inhibitor of the protein kinase-like [Oopsacas minuta]